MSEIYYYFIIYYFYYTSHLLWNVLPEMELGSASFPLLRDEKYN